MAHYIYGIYDPVGTLIYVGLTEDMLKRRLSHNGAATGKLKQWRLANPGTTATMKQLAVCPDYDIGCIVEMCMIATLKPTMNAPRLGRVRSVGRHMHSKALIQ